MLADRFYSALSEKPAPMAAAPARLAPWCRSGPIEPGDTLTILADQLAGHGIAQLAQTSNLASALSTRYPAIQAANAFDFGSMNTDFALI
jgi:hypothetical protein